MSAIFVPAPKWLYMARESHIPQGLVTYGMNFKCAFNTSWNSAPFISLINIFSHFLMIILLLQSVAQIPVSIPPPQSTALYFTEEKKYLEENHLFLPSPHLPGQWHLYPYSPSSVTKDELFILLRQSLSFVHWMSTFCPIKYLSCIFLLIFLHYCSVLQGGIIPVIKKQTNQNQKGSYNSHYVK